MNRETAKEFGREVIQEVFITAGLEPKEDLVEKALPSVINIIRTWIEDVVLEQYCEDCEWYMICDDCPRQYMMRNEGYL